MLYNIMDLGQEQRQTLKIEKFILNLESSIKNINRQHILYLLCLLIILFLLRKLNISYMNIFLFAIGLIMSYYTIYSKKYIEEKIVLITIIICIIVGPVLNETYNYYNNSRKKKKILN